MDVDGLRGRGAPFEWARVGAVEKESSGCRVARIRGRTNEGRPGA